MNSLFHACRVILCRCFFYLNIFCEEFPYEKMRCRACSPVSYRYFLSPRAFAAGYELPEGTSITAQSAYFVNLDTGIVVFEQNADEQRSVASLTKLMTALLLMENVSDLESTMIEANRDLYTGAIIDPTVRASHADIRPGEHVSALNMLYAMMLPSANEAAEAVGYYLGNGNLNNFYALMNARAAAGLHQHQFHQHQRACGYG